LRIVNNALNFSEYRGMGRSGGPPQTKQNDERKQACDFAQKHSNLPVTQRDSAFMKWMVKRKS
jgi:hypothetical protein